MIPPNCPVYIHHFPRAVFQVPLRCSSQGQVCGGALTWQYSPACWTGGIHCKGEDIRSTLRIPFLIWTAKPAQSQGPVFEVHCMLACNPNSESKLLRHSDVKPGLDQKIRSCWVLWIAKQAATTNIIMCLPVIPVPLLQLTLLAPLSNTWSSNGGLELTFQDLRLCVLSPHSKYRRLSKICPWAMNFSGCSKRGVGVFSRTLSPENRPTPFKSRPTLF